MVGLKDRAAGSPGLLLRGGTLIDGRGQAPLRDSAILIRGNKIVEVSAKSEIECSHDLKVLDIAGKYVIPGLIDIHVHYSDWMGPLFVEHGVTTVKDLGNDIDWISQVSAEIDAEKVQGPRLFYVGNGLDAAPPERDNHVGVTSPEMARRAVRLLASRGVSAIKVREKITPELLQVIVDESHSLRLPVTGHLKRTDAREAALAGIDGLEHVSGFAQAVANADRQPFSGGDGRRMLMSDLMAFATAEPGVCEELIDLLVERNVALVPTLPVWWRMAMRNRADYAKEDAEYAQRPALSYVPEFIRNLWTTPAFFEVENDFERSQIESGYANLMNILSSFCQAGGRLLGGTDTFVFIPGLNSHRELELFAELGLEPLEIISLVTRANAEFLGQGTQLGTIEPGKLADVVVLHADPLKEISNTQKIALVIKDGQIVEQLEDAKDFIPSPKPALTRPLWLEQQLA
jgi:imidazolonepropionase-like amidohydrolase